MCFEFFHSTEIEFEKAPTTMTQTFIRLKTPNGENIVMEVRTREHVKGTNTFFRAEARTVWREWRSDWLTFESGRFHSVRNAVQVTVDEAKGVSKFGPKGNIIMTPAGCGLGSFLMSRVIRWLREKHPEVRVLPGHLAANDASDEENRKRRNRFYKKHNFDFDWYEDGVSGSFFKDRAGDLTEISNGIEEFSADELAQLYCGAKAEIRQISHNLRVSDNARRELEVIVAKRNRAIFASIAIIFLFVIFPVAPHAIQEIVLAVFGS